MFMGEYHHNLDSKGRLIIPAKFRVEIGDKMIFTRGMEGCIFGYPIEEWQKIEAKLAKLPLTKRSARKFTRLFYSGAMESEFDKQGRVNLTMTLKEHAALIKECVIVGVSNRIATFGGGGHARYLLSKLNKGTVIGFDQDEYAISMAKESFAKELQVGAEPRLMLVHDNFCHLKENLVELGISDGIDGIYYDLGVSSPQFDQPERGFSYRFDARLDMRMDQSQELDAYTIVNTWSQKELSDVLYKYGDEKFSRQIARKIVDRRKEKPIVTTFDLVDVIKDAIPAYARRSGGHPAKKSFQAIRVAVNNELGVLQESLEEAIKLLKPGGRISVITFQSHEDKIVKKIFKKYSEVEIPRGMPMVPADSKPTLRLISRKPIMASSDELEENNRSHSAKLRVAEKL